ncbi:MAG: WG repeat-containing protein [Tannerella sp.]|jgi:hypothetical protein|nr:WG repeat-containing protein [Tannerella sp.]
MKNKAVLSILGLLVLLFSGCKCINGKYIHEDDVLYVKERMPNSRQFFYADKFGNPKLPEGFPLNRYKWANPFSCGLALVQDQNNKWKYIDKNGDVIIDASEYIMCWGFGEAMRPGAGGLKGLAYVCKSESDTWDFSYISGDKGEYTDSGTRFGFINLKGRVVLPVEYENIAGNGAFFPNDAIWWVRKNGLYGAINEKAKFIIPLKYADINFFEYGCALVKLGGLWGLINKKGQTVFPFSITEYKQFGTVRFQLRILAKQGEYWGVINEKGKTVIPFVYSRWEEFQERTVLRIYKEDGSFITWNFKEDKYAD